MKGVIVFQDCRDMSAVGFVKDQHANFPVHSPTFVQIIPYQVGFPGNAQPRSGRLTAVETLAIDAGTARQNEFAFDDLALPPSGPALVRSTDAGNVGIPNALKPSPRRRDTK